MADGIPVFTVGVQSNGNELSNFTQISMNEGRQAAQIVLDWMEADRQRPQRLRGVRRRSDPELGAGPHAGLHRRHQGSEAGRDLHQRRDRRRSRPRYDPATTYDAYTALLLGNPDLQFIENVDIGAEHADRAIVDAGREGQVFTIGWNVSEGQMDAVEQGIQVAALDQKWGDQAAFGAVACADFLANGVIRPNTQELVPVTQENVEEAREEFRSITGG